MTNKYSIVQKDCTPRQHITGTKPLCTESAEWFSEPTYINDYEIIPHHFDEHENECEINAFMKKYVFKPYTLGKNVVGVELNFNKEFYVPEQMDSVEDILKELEGLDKEMKGFKV